MAKKLPNEALVLDNPKVDWSAGPEDRRKVTLIIHTTPIELRMIASMLEERNEVRVNWYHTRYSFRNEGTFGGGNPMSGSISDKELADNLDAQDRLVARGHVREKCKTCDGLGHLRSSLVGLECPSCEGRGFHWRAAITK